MEPEIPMIIEELYSYFITEPNPAFWPERYRDDAVKGHSLWAFYQGLRLGIRLTDACLEKL